MPRSNTASSLESIFKRNTIKPSFQPEVLTAIDESIGYETFLDNGTVSVRIQNLDGSGTVEIPAEQLAGARYIIQSALSLNAPRKRRSKEEIEAQAKVTSELPEEEFVMSSTGESPDMEEDNEADEKGEEDEVEEAELAAVGSRSRRR